MKTNREIKIGQFIIMAIFVFILSTQVSFAGAGNFWIANGTEREISVVSANGLLDATFYDGCVMANDATRLTDDALNQIRGGLGGLRFGISFSGVFDRLGNLTGQIFSGNDNIPQELIEDAISKTRSNETKPAVTNAATEANRPSTVSPTSRTSRIPQTSRPSTVPQAGDTNLVPPTDGINTAPQIAKIETAEVEGAAISAYVGNFDGASGIFQISQSPGSYNVITNNMTINISIYNFASESQASAILPRFLNTQ